MKTFFRDNSPFLVGASLIILASAWGYSMRYQDKSGCDHNWAQWGEPVIVNDWLSGTKAYQTRQCGKCGQSQVRKVRATQP